MAICQGVLSRGKKSTDDVSAAIENLFGDDISPKLAVTLSSVHKAKGREWRRVIFLDKPVMRQLKDWEQIQEQNLRYVAITRAMRTLLFLPIAVEPREKMKLTRDDKQAELIGDFGNLAPQISSQLKEESAGSHPSA